MEIITGSTDGDVNLLEVSQHVGRAEKHSGRVSDVPADSLSKRMSGTLKLVVRTQR